MLGRPPGVKAQPTSAAPEASPTAVAIWTTTCEVFSNGSFQLLATNNSGRVRETPGWTVILFDGSEVAGSTATADESVAYGYGAPVLPIVSRARVRLLTAITGGSPVSLICLLLAAEPFGIPVLWSRRLRLLRNFPLRSFAPQT